MLDERAFVTRLRIDKATLRRWVHKGWISTPLSVNGGPRFREVDVARADLILDLGELGVNDDGIDVVLDLLDQLHGLRQALSAVIQALGVQPRDLQRHIVNDAHRLHRLHRLRRRRLMRLPDNRPRGQQTN